MGGLPKDRHDVELLGGGPEGEDAPQLTVTEQQSLTLVALIPRRIPAEREGGVGEGFIAEHIVRLHGDGLHLEQAAQQRPGEQGEWHAGLPVPPRQTHPPGANASPVRLTYW